MIYRKATDLCVAHISRVTYLHYMALNKHSPSLHRSKKKKKKKTQTVSSLVETRLFPGPKIQLLFSTNFILVTFES